MKILRDSDKSLPAVVRIASRIDRYLRKKQIVQLIFVILAEIYIMTGASKNLTFQLDLCVIPHCY